MDYEGYISSPKWAAFRTRYFSSDWPSGCVVCSATSRMTLHHVSYVNLGDESFIDVVPLCWPCHDRLHAEESRAGCGGVEAFIRQASAVFGIRQSLLRSRMQKWVGRAPETQLTGRSLKRHKRKQKRQLKTRQQMARDKAMHARMCRT